jgi:hypothetical protein
MPRYKPSEVAATPQPTGWQQTITDRLRTKKQVLPLISQALCNDLVLGGDSALSTAYGKYGGYPLDAQSLAQMAQFKSIVEGHGRDRQAICDDYINFVKNRLYDIAEAEQVNAELLQAIEAQFDTLSFAGFCQQLGYPRFDGGDDDPLLLLSEFDLPIYFTTSYHGFIEAALRRKGKQPRSDYPRWHRDLERYPTVFTGNYEPTDLTCVNEPVVYHLLGYDEVPSSMVLTEDDHLKFMVACSTDIGRNTDRVHGRMRDALSDSSLLVLGYSLASWEFRALFWSSIVHRSQSLTSVIAVQLAPSEQEKKYVDSYLDLFEFKTFWGSTLHYVQQLYQAVSGG